jgi:UDP-N-acetylglucosamine 2-epimerase (non-hydrolysing)
MGTHALFIVGTRPEAIKVAPIVKQLRSMGIADSVQVCVSGQHSSRACDQLMDCGVAPDVLCAPLAHPLGLSTLLSLLLRQLSEVVKALRPSMVIVQGDTATALAAALAATHSGIPIAHVEAGLRTGSLAAPFPEEKYRRILGSLAELHFAPTPLAVQNLRMEGVPADSIVLTGNTVVDAFNEHIARYHLAFGAPRRRVVVSLHRREILGVRLESMFRAVCALADKHPDFEFACQINANPAVARALESARNGRDRSNMTRIEQLSYRDCLELLAGSYFIMTDSGGIQEEAPLLGKPVLVLRGETDRPEGIATGGAKLVGTSAESIIASASELIENREIYARMAHVHSPFGDGNASQRISDAIGRRLANVAAGEASALILRKPGERRPRKINLGLQFNF